MMLSSALDIQPQWFEKKNTSHGLQSDFFVTSNYTEQVLLPRVDAFIINR